jgi:hypothetical protein
MGCDSEKVGEEIAFRIAKLNSVVYKLNGIIITFLCQVREQKLLTKR